MWFSFLGHYRRVNWSCYLNWTKCIKVRSSDELNFIYISHALDVHVLCTDSCDYRKQMVTFSKTFWGKTTVYNVTYVITECNELTDGIWTVCDGEWVIRAEPLFSSFKGQLKLNASFLALALLICSLGVICVLRLCYQLGLLQWRHSHSPRLP